VTRRGKPKGANIPRTEWKPRDPRGLFGLRDELIAVMRNEQWLVNTAESLREGRGTIQPHGTPMEGAVLLAQDETTRLRAATVCSVSAPMARLAVKAGEQLPTWGLRRDDLPRKEDGTAMLSGFMVFDAPIAEYVSEQQLGGPVVVSIVAASWGPTTLLFGDETLWVTFYSARPPSTIALAELAAMFGISERELRDNLDAATATLMWDNEIVGQFGGTEVRIAGVPEPIDPAAPPASYAAAHTASWLQTVRAAWMMMRPTTDSPGRRPLAEVVDVPTSSKATRRALREGIAMNTEPVRVLQLHHSRRNTAPYGRAGKKLDHQHEVEPHVRWQHYPSRGTIELIAIDTYVRGPKDAPFRPKPEQPKTVVRLDRPPGGRPPLPGEVQ
jgi:hypothetical protein